VGVAILNAKPPGVTDDGRILLKTMRVGIGYVFAANLLWRLQKQCLSLRANTI